MNECVGSLDEKLVQAERLAEQLSAAADGLNAAIVRIEQRLKVLSLGVRARVRLVDDVYLAYGRHGGAWKLTIESPSVSSPLLNASREYRVLAVQMLGELFDALIAMAAQQLDAVGGASVVASKFADAIGAPPADVGADDGAP